MKGLARLLAWPRLGALLGFTAGAALLGGGVGLGLGVTLLPTATAGVPTVATALAAVGPGAAFGWWVGLFWGLAVALVARRTVPPPAPGALRAAAWLAAAGTLAAGLAGHLLAGAAGTGALVGLIAASLIVRVWLARR